MKLVQQLCDRYKIPNDYRELATITAEYHTHVHRAFEILPKTLYQVLEAADAFRRPERFEQFLLACTADSRGRTGYEDDEFPQADFYRAAFEAARLIDAKVLVESGLQGAEIGKALREQRIAAIATCREQPPE